VAFIQANNLVVISGVDKDHRGELFRGWQTIYSVDFKAEDISAAFVPGNRLALADISEEMMLCAGGKLLAGEFKICRPGGCASGYSGKDQ